ncbi:lysophospholipid acyltransferase family protein [Pseudonocardia abyssalis]|uniref:1-acyl-sn-glycerol-3-phosphate acyltransferase n=1 Tax=Pseudonocardia abyssalis TaxID=2792008 RepID=A0ABS6ULL9_9PSEU|nr:lysophospholipid acyltransferase family protein [Pseudonocardia abyssalis]MBW0117385.1 1-acyl-sn-glycerol-3-phosphate acyltransferase [Pseudonocardia abyssalis]MBW0132793.1 1-acyl-sn-glycerol-3-phosphate acyltransferase [Pseudonocardia abyssalis]
MRPLTTWQKLRLTVTRRWDTSGFWYGFAIWLLWPFTMFGTKIGWRGGEHIPRTGGALLALNHVSFADPIFDVAFTVSHGRMPRFLAKSELWDVPVVRSVLGKGGHIPVFRSSARAGDAYREAIAAVQRGEIVAFYPEATYTADPTGWPMKAKNGIGRIALVTGAPVIPVANWGTQDVLPPGTNVPRLFFPRRRVTVVAGPPVDLTRWLGGPRTRTALDGVTGAIMADVTALVAGIRGETPPAVPYDPATARTELPPSGPPTVAVPPVEERPTAS